LLLKFKGDDQEPHSPDFYLRLTNPLNPSDSIPATVNGFFRRTSWGKLQWRADVAGEGGLNPTGWLTLPHNRLYYVDCDPSLSCADVGALSDDGLKLAVEAGVDLSLYDNINFVLNNDLDCCAKGGGTSYGDKFFGATWMPPWGQETSVYAHEYGHSIGLPHSGWVYYDYDNPWDIMSSLIQVKIKKCGSYISAKSEGELRELYCSSPGNGFNIAYVDYLGWIPETNRIIIDGEDNLTATLEASSLPLGSGIKMIKICIPNKPCSGYKADYFTVEARVEDWRYDKGVPGDGIVIHHFVENRRRGEGPCFRSATGGGAAPVDATPGDYNKKNCRAPHGRHWPNYALFNSQFLPGMIYINSKFHFSVSVIERIGSSYVVTVSRSQ